MGKTRMQTGSMSGLSAQCQHCMERGGTKHKHKADSSTQQQTHSTHCKTHNRQYIALNKLHSSQSKAYKSICKFLTNCHPEQNEVILYISIETEAILGEEIDHFVAILFLYVYFCIFLYVFLNFTFLFIHRYFLAP